MGSKRGKSEAAMVKVVERAIQQALTGGSFLDTIANLIQQKVAEAVKTLKENLEANTLALEDTRKELLARDQQILQLKQDLEVRTDELEMYQRRQSLRVFGLSERDGENTDELVVDLAKNIGVDITVNDIDRSHRVGVKDGKKTRAIIVKFVSYIKRSELFRNKRLLKGTGKVIHEDLTSARLQLLQSTISRFGLKNVWTKDGAIIVKTGQTKHRVTCLKDLNNIS